MKRLSSLQLFYSGLLITLLGSCSYSSYIPVTVSEPMLTQKGERQGIAYLGSNHIEIQGAYAVTNHFGIQGNIWKDLQRRYSMDLLPGYYYHNPNGFCLGVYAGAGMANTSGIYEYSYNDLFHHVSEKKVNEVRYTSLICQQGVGYRGKYFEIGFAQRFSYISFTQYDVKNYKWNPNETSVPQLENAYRDNRFNIWIYQPALNISAGREHVKAFFSASMNIPSDLKGEHGGYYHPYFQSYLFSTGLKVDLMAPKKFKSKQNLEF